VADFLRKACQSNVLVMLLSVQVARGVNVSIRRWVFIGILCVDFFVYALSIRGAACYLSCPRKKSCS
jgi:hypothetical protein